MTRVYTALSTLLLCAGFATSASAFNIVQCLQDHSKAECSRQMMIEEEQSKPIAAGDEIIATSGKYSVTLQGESWLKNGFASTPEKSKDLGLIRDSGEALINFEMSTVAEADFETTITQDMKGIFAGLQNGFRKGKINIVKKSEMELLHIAVVGGNVSMGRFCYHIDVKDGKNVCVYEGFVGRTTGDSVKFLGSVGDFDNMREDLESIISSFKFKE